MDRNVKGCQKKVSQLLLHHTTVLLKNLLTYIHNSNISVKFEENCLKQNKVSFTHENVVNVFIVYQLDIWSRDLNSEFTLKDCLFGFV